MVMRGTAPDKAKAEAKNDDLERIIAELRAQIADLERRLAGR